MLPRLHAHLCSTKMQREVKDTRCVCGVFRAYLYTHRMRENPGFAQNEKVTR